MTRFVARLLMVTGIGHALVGVALFGDPLAAMAREGFVNTIRYGQFDRAAAFWFLLFSPICVLLGRMVAHATDRGDRWLLTVVAWNVLAMGVVGAVIMPLSGFWILLVIAPLAFRLARALPMDSVALAGTAEPTRSAPPNRGGVQTERGLAGTEGRALGSDRVWLNEGIGWDW
jgi:hypothetical protein